MEARIDNSRFWIADKEDASFKEEIEELLTCSGFTILNFMEHYFDPQGYTAIWLLAESHCALHTFPEESRVYVELSSCNYEMYCSFNQYVTKQFPELQWAK